MEQEGRRNQKIELLILVALSFVLSQLSAGMFFFTVPLLLAAPKFKDKKAPVALIVLSGVFSVVMDLVNYKDVLFDSKYFGIVGFALYYPVTLTVLSVMWVLLSDFSNVVLRKFVVGSIPVAVIGIGFSIYLVSEAGSVSYNTFMQAIASMIPEQFSAQLDIELFARTFMTILTYGMVPFGLVFSAVPVLVSELILHKEDKLWQDDFANMLMPPAFAWVWMIFMAAGLAGCTVVTYPVWLSVVIWNFVLGLTLHYILAGISIVCARVRKKTVDLRSSKICSTCIVCCLMPGVNIFFVTGLSLLGILETWFRLR